MQPVHRKLAYPFLRLRCLLGACVALVGAETPSVLKEVSYGDRLRLSRRGREGRLPHAVELPALAAPVPEGTLGAGVSGSAKANNCLAQREAREAPGEVALTAAEIHDHFRKIATWVDWQKTCDGFLAGDPTTSVQAIAVAWMADGEVVNQAREKGCNLLVVHEPLDPAVARGLVVYRCHDVWDLMPGIGVRDSWCRGLGLEGLPCKAEGPLRVYDIPATSLAALADEVKRKLAPISRGTVSIVGDATGEVKKFGVGTGAMCNPAKLRGMGADAAIVTEGACRRAEAWLAERGFPVICVSHEDSEAWGMGNLAEYLGRNYPAVRVWHLRPERAS